MAEAARSFSLFRRRPPAPWEQERALLLKELSRTRVALAQAYNMFNHVDAPELIESCVFEINALQSRYSYLLRRAKECEAP